MRLLAARPSSAEAELPFAALIDLCETVDSDVLSEIPAPQRLALEVALLRAEPQGQTTGAACHRARAARRDSRARGTVDPPDRD